jgi:hypothetical protein
VASSACAGTAGGFVGGVEATWLMLRRAQSVWVIVNARCPLMPSPLSEWRGERCVGVELDLHHLKSFEGFEGGVRVCCVQRGEYRVEKNRHAGGACCCHLCRCRKKLQASSIDEHLKSRLNDELA